MKYFWLVLLTGCSQVTFDSLEFDRYVTITETAAQIKKSCSKSEAVRSELKHLVKKVEHMNRYATLREPREEVKEATILLTGLVREIDVRYTENMAPSEFYCVEKLSTIETAAETISKTLGRF